MTHPQSVCNMPTVAHLAPRFTNNENVALDREGYVYAVLFSDGWIKVGRARNPKSRVSTHSGTAAMRKATIVESVISGRIAGSVAAERKLIGFCNQNGTPAHGREWFTGVDFEELSALIADQFSGDSDEVISAGRERRDVMENKIADAMMAAFTPERRVNFDDQDPVKWACSQSHARVLEQLFLGDMYGGELFSDTGDGYSRFFLMASLAVHNMDAPGLSEVYASATSNPDECIQNLTCTANKLVEEFRQGVSA